MRRPGRWKSAIWNEGGTAMAKPVYCVDCGAECYEYFFCDLCGEGFFCRRCMNLHLCDDDWDDWEDWYDWYDERDWDST